VPAPDRRVGFVESMGLLGLVIFLVARFAPLPGAPLWACPWRAWSGWPCLGCGLTRAAVHLAHGELGAALALQPLGTVLYLALGLAALCSAWHLLSGRPYPALALPPTAARALRLGFGAAVVLNYAWVAWQTVPASR